MLETTLEKLAREETDIYLDNSVLNRDINDKTRKKIYQEVGREPADLPLRLGAAKKFSDVKQCALNRQAYFCCHFNQIVTSYANLKSVPEVLAEYDAFIKHLEVTLKFFKGRSRVRKPGKKELKLKEIIETHLNTYRILEERSAPQPDGCLFSSLLKEKRMHFSRDSLYVKRCHPVSQEASEGDADLVGNALANAFIGKETAILSQDLDIVNLVRNFAQDHHHNLIELGQRKIQGKVSVYFPSETGWVPGFKVSFVCNTAGKFVFLTETGPETRQADFNEKI